MESERPEDPKALESKQSSPMEKAEDKPDVNQHDLDETDKKAQETKKLMCTDVRRSSRSCNTQDLSTQSWESMVEHMRLKLKLPLGPTSVLDIPNDVILSIFLRLPSKHHRLRMALSSRVWRDVYVLYSFMIPEELPWLLMPSSAQPLVHATTESMTYNHNLGPDIRQDARFCGSMEGGVVVVALESSSENMLFNLNSRRPFPLPNTLVFGGEIQNIRVEAGVPYGWPVRDSTCVVGAIVKDVRNNFPSVMAYWQHGMQHWVHIKTALGGRSDNQPINILDVLYHSQRHAFIFLSQDLNVHVMKLVFDDNHRLIMDCEDLEVRGSWLNVRLMEIEAISHLHYLAQSGDDILRITKNLGDNQKTRNLVVFKLDQQFVLSASKSEEEEEEEEEKEAHGIVSWSRACTLQGRIVFAGRASSRVLESAGTFRDHVLFHEDRPDQEHMPVQAMFDRSDMGMYSMQLAAVEAWPPAGGAVIAPDSDMCPSTWWFH